MLKTCKVAVSGNVGERNLYVNMHIKLGMSKYIALTDKPISEQTDKERVQMLIDYFKEFIKSM